MDGGKGCRKKYRVVVRENGEWNISKGRQRTNIRSNYKEKETYRDKRKQC